MSSEFKKYKIGELYDSSSGLSKGRADFGFGFPFLTFKEVFNNYFVPDQLINMANTTERERNNCSINKGDIFITRTSETQHELGMSSVALKDYPEATFNGFTKRLRMKTGIGIKIYPKYMGYYLRSIDVRNQIHGFSTLTTRSSLNNSMLDKIEIKLPHYEEQKVIADTLFCIDKKIELNNAINKNLEEMAKVTFKRWFVDFEFPNEFGEPYKSSGGEFEESERGPIPVGWAVKSLAELTSKFATGLNPRKNFVLGQGINYYVTIKNMGQNKIYLDDKCDRIDNEALLKINKRSDLQEGDLLFSGIGTIGRVYFIDKKPENWNTSESIFTLRAHKPIFAEFLYLLLLSDDFQQYARKFASGSVQKGIRMADLKRYKLPVPQNDLIEHFSKVAMSLIAKIKKNDSENENLKLLKDTLLPKLMSGEIRVSVERENSKETNLPLVAETNEHYNSIT